MVQNFLSLSRDHFADTHLVDHHELDGSSKYNLWHEKSERSDPSELAPQSMPTQELESSEVSRPVYELPSSFPLPSQPARQYLRPKVSASKICDKQPYCPADVSPLAQVYNADSPGAVSDISLDGSNAKTTL